MAANDRSLYRQIARVQQGPKVRAKLREVAERVKGNAEAVAAEEGVTNVTFEIEDGERPRGRSFSRVSMNPGDAEYGTEFVSARRILGRAARR